MEAEDPDAFVPFPFVPLPPRAIERTAGSTATAMDMDDDDMDAAPSEVDFEVCHLLETLPLELLLNVLAQTDKRSLGRLACSSLMCHQICCRGQLVWSRMLAQELRCGVPPGALRDLPAKEALRRWTTQTSWKWCEQRLQASRGCALRQRQGKDGPEL